MSKKANGEHSIYFDNTKKLYKGQIVIGRKEDGKLNRKYVYGKTKKEVREKLAQIEYGVMTGTFLDKSSITIHQLAKQILDDDFNLNYIKENTYFRHLETLKRLRPICGTPLQNASESQLKDFLLTQQNYAQSTINKTYELLNRTFKEAKRRKIIRENPMENIKCPRSRKAPEKARALTVPEQQRLIEVLTTEDIPYSNQMLLSLFTGMRMGEVNALQVEDLFFDFRQITINKTISRGQKGEAILSHNPKTEAGERTIPMSEDVRILLEDCCIDKESGFLFLHKNRMITTNQVNEQFKRVLKKYGIEDSSVPGKLSVHSLRHTYATRMIENDCAPKALQRLLGHTDIRITMNTYCDAFDAYQKMNIEKAMANMEKQGISLGDYFRNKPEETIVKTG